METMAIVEAAVTAVGLYLALGGFFALVFIIWGAGAVEAGARGARLPFRLIIVPGVIALWPILMILWVRRGLKGDRSHA